MRIIAGTHRRREIKAPKGMDTRPTSDRVKEAIFSSLGDKVKGSQVLDLFSGSGNLAFESLSRGAKSACLVEKDPNAYKTIMDNVKKLDMADLVKVYKMDWEHFIKIAVKEKKKFDLIFLDPPYYGKYYYKILKKITKKDILKNNGVIVIEAPKEILIQDLDEEDNLEKDFLKLVKEKRYGETKIFYIQKSEV